MKNERVVKQPMFGNFPDNLDPEKMRIVKYAQGERFDSCTGMEFNLFDVIIYRIRSCNANNKKVFHHADGHLNGERVFLVLEEIPQEKVINTDL